MVNFHIAYDGLDAGLGNYFELSKLDIANFIFANCIDHHVSEIPSPQCTLAYIDELLPQINTQNFIFVVYSHGDDDQLLSDGTHYIKRGINHYLFSNSLFYSMSCLSGRELGQALVANGSHVFIGYKEEINALLGAFLQLSIDCDNHALKNFILGKPIGHCYDEMKEFFTEKIDELVANGEPMRASTLRATRDALVFEGNRELTLDNFRIN